MAEKIKCPICGAEFEKDGYELADGTVCGNCEKNLRFAFPITYIPNPNPFKKCLPDLSGIFEDENLTSRQKADRIEELRGIPLNRADPHPKGYYTVDRMHSLTVKEFREKTGQAEGLRNQLLRRFDDYDNVCTVADVRPMAKLRASDGFQKMLRFRGAMLVSGTVQLGCFREGDSVTVLRDGKKLLEADIMEERYIAGCAVGDISGCESSECQQKVREGRQVRMTLTASAEGIKPGDLIVSDD